MKKSELRQIIKEELSKGPFKPEIKEAGKSPFISFDMNMVHKRAIPLHVLLGTNKGNVRKLNQVIFDALKKYSSLPTQEEMMKSHNQR